MELFGYTFPSIFRKKEELDLLSGTVWEPLVYLAFPLVITNLLQTAYNLADTIWLGRYSVEALAAISYAFPVIFFLISLGIGVSVAGSILVAQRSGSGNTEQAKKAASQAFVYSIILSGIIGLLGFTKIELVLSLFGAEPQVLEMATSYMQIISLGLIFIFGFTVFISLSRGAGDTVTPMVVMAFSVFINILIDPILIFGFTNNPFFTMTGLTSLQLELYHLTAYTGHGIVGAAYATIFSRAIAFAIAVYLMFNTSRGVTLSLSKMKPDFNELKQLVRLGIPASISSVGRSISVNLMLLIVGIFPTTVVAGYGVGIRVFSIIFLPAIAVGESLETVTGYNYGANKKDRVVKVNHFSAKSMFLLLSILGAVIWWYAPYVATIFTDNPTTINASTDFIRIVAPTFGFIGVLRAYAGGFRGIGKTLTAAAISVSTLAVLRLPMAYFLIQWLNEEGIWFAFAVSNIAGAIIAIVLFKRILKA